MTSITLADIHKLVEKLDEAQRTLADIEATFNDAKEVVRELSEETIPHALESLGLDEIKTASGLKVTVRETVHARLSHETKAEAIQWLDENGHAGLVKRKVQIDFDREEAEAAMALLEELQGRFPAVYSDQTVHPSTLRAFVKGLVEDGEEFPRELFGTYIKKQAKVSSK